MQTVADSTQPPCLWSNWKCQAVKLLYWRDVKQTGLLLSAMLLLLLSLTQFSVVSVMAYLALAALSTTISFRVYKSVLQAVQKTDEGHPFKAYLEMEVALSPEQMQRYAETAQHYLNSSLKELRRLFLVQDLVDSLKFAVLMWLLTYVGALFNGLTLLIMGEEPQDPGLCTGLHTALYPDLYTGLYTSTVCALYYTFTCILD
uniref:Reticulon n=1 Tax=Paramormyrops kingsleyae TaxID=1676925 RepID=A0A3B3Q5U2_9TELE